MHARDLLRPSLRQRRVDVVQLGVFLCMTPYKQPLVYAQCPFEWQ